MNSIHISALVAHLPKVLPCQSYGTSSRLQSSSLGPTPHYQSLPHGERTSFEHFLAQISRLVMLHCDRLDARGLSNVLWATVRLGYCPSHEVLNCLLFACYTKMQDFNAQELANLAWALATAGTKPVQPLMNRLLVQLGRVMHDLKPQELANMTWACARLELHLPGHLVDRLSSTALQLLPSFRPSELVMMLTALMKLPGSQQSSSSGLRHGGGTKECVRSRQAEVLLDESFLLLASRVESLNAQDLCNWLHLLARLQYSPPARSFKSMLVSGSPVGSVPAVASNIVPAAVIAKARSNHQPSFSQTSTAAGRTRSANLASSTSSQQHVMRGSSSSTSKGPEISSAPQGGPRLPHTPAVQLLHRAPQDQLYEHILDCSTSLLSTFTPQGLSTIAWSAAKLQVQPSDTWLRALVGQSSLLLDKMSGQGLANLIWALARMGCVPGPRWMSVFLHVVGLKLPAFRDEELAALVYALGVMKVCPPEAWVQALCEEASSRMSKGSMAILEVGILMHGCVAAGMPVSREMTHAALVCAAAQGQAAGAQDSIAAGAPGVLQGGGRERGQVAGESSCSSGTPHGLVMLMSLLSALPEAQLPTNWMQQMSSMLQPFAQHLGFNHVLQVLTALVRCRYRQQGLIDAALLHALLASLQRQAHAMSSAELSQALHSLALLRYQPSGTWMQCMMAHVEVQQGLGMPLQDVSKVLAALAKLRYRPAAALLAACSRQICNALETGASISDETGHQSQEDPEPWLPSTMVRAVRAITLMTGPPKGHNATLLVELVKSRPDALSPGQLMWLLHTLVVHSRARLYCRGWRLVLQKGVLPRLHTFRKPGLRHLAALLQRADLKAKCAVSARGALQQHLRGTALGGDRRIKMSEDAPGQLADEGAAGCDASGCDEECQVLEA